MKTVIDRAKWKRQRPPARVRSAWLYIDSGQKVAHAARHQKSQWK